MKIHQSEYSSLDPLTVVNSDNELMYVDGMEQDLLILLSDLHNTN